MQKEALDWDDDETALAKNDVSNQNENANDDNVVDDNPDDGPVIEYVPMQELSRRMIFRKLCGRYDTKWLKVQKH